MDPLSISSAAREAASRMALIAGERRWTFAELANQVAIVRARLAEHRVPVAARVAVRATNRIEAVAVLLALIEEGRGFVPIHPRLTAAEAALLVADSDAAISLDDGGLAALMEGGPRDVNASSIDPPAELAMLYTSGTTGRPKGAILSRAAFIASASGSAKNLGWADEDRWLLCMPVCHVGGLSILTRCLIARRCVVLMPRFEPEAVLSTIVREKVTLLSVVPTMLSALLDVDRNNTLAGLRAMLVGGAAAPSVLMEECATRGIPALATYGLTEACSQVTVQRLQRRNRAEPGSGVPLDGMQVSVLGERDEPLSVGEIGRIHVRGPSVMTGYWRQPAVHGSFDTGDLGWFDDLGRLHIAARRTDLIVTGGENVYPSEVEQSLVQVPGVREALVFGVPDVRWGQVVAAALVANGPVDEAALRAWTKQRLAPFKRPRLICWVKSLPLNAAGKADRARAIRDLRGLLRNIEGQPLSS